MQCQDLLDKKMVYIENPRFLDNQKIGLIYPYKIKKPKIPRGVTEVSLIRDILSIHLLLVVLTLGNALKK
jgi:hypothetical protein